MVMNAYALLKENGKPTAQQCMDSFDGNICRCTGYRNLVNASETFAKDASPTCQELAGKFTPFDADREKLSAMPPPSRPISKVFAAGGTTWYAPTTLSEVIALRTKLRRAAIVLGDTAKGIRSGAYETYDGKAQDVIYLGNVAELQVETESNGCLVFGAARTVQNVIDRLKAKGGTHKDLAEALGKNSTLRTLSVEDCGIEDAAAVLLLEALGGSGVEEFRGANNRCLEKATRKRLRAWAKTQQ